jgi:hypothetical protein
MNAFLISRMHVQSKKEGMVTAMWLKSWNLDGRLENPPNKLKFPMKLACLHTYALNMAYITPLDQSETIRCFRRRIYSVVHTMMKAQQEIRAMRIETLHPISPWPIICGTYMPYGLPTTLNRFGF